jgi:hypothetical protein
MRAVSISISVSVWIWAAGCGQAADRPAPRPDPARAPAPAPIAATPEAPAPAELREGTFAVIHGMGLLEVTGMRQEGGHLMLAFTDRATGDGMMVDSERALDPAVARAPVSRAEAERRLALLENTTPVTDSRSNKERFVEHARTLARGTDEQLLALLRAEYASTFAAGSYNSAIRGLERRLVPELAHVLGVEVEALTDKLHATHAVRGAYAKTATPRPPDPPSTPPEDPWALDGHDYVGAFTLQGDRLAAGDPVYLGSHHDEPPQDVTKNVGIPAAAGRWHCYVELDPEQPDDITLSLIAIHDDARRAFAGARRKAVRAAALWVDSGQIAVVDAAIRDDAAYDDARLFGADDGGIIGGRGCMVQSGAGDGTYTTRVLARDGAAIYVHVDFTGASRDFRRQARERIR